MILNNNIKNVKQFSHFHYIAFELDILYICICNKYIIVIKSSVCIRLYSLLFISIFFALKIIIIVVTN